MDIRVGKAHLIAALRILNSIKTYELLVIIPYQNTKQQGCRASIPHYLWAPTPPSPAPAPTPNTNSTIYAVELPQTMLI